MKTKIEYKKSETADIVWYTWDEYCDDCGKIIKLNGEWLSSQEPDISKKDRCLTCLGNLLDSM
jgi:hypothetical protein